MLVRMRLSFSCLETKPGPKRPEGEELLVRFQIVIKKINKMQTYEMQLWSIRRNYLGLIADRAPSQKDLDVKHLCFGVRTAAYPTTTACHREPLTSKRANKFPCNHKTTKI